MRVKLYLFTSNYIGTQCEDLSTEFYTPPPSPCHPPPPHTHTRYFMLPTVLVFTTGCFMLSLVWLFVLLSFSSLEPLGELIVWADSVVRPSSVVHTLQTFSPQKPLCQWKPNFIRSIHGSGKWKCLFIQILWQTYIYA